jgi:Protein of unknown function (DUF2637)
MNRITAWLAARLPRRRRPAAITRRAGDGAFTVITMSVVAFVALIAASASYQHQYELAIRHGQTHWVAGLLPFSVDGMIVSATLVLWYAARHGYPRPWGAWLVLMAGVAATAIANLAADARYGWAWLGPAISVWPAVAFVAAYEMAVWLVRKRQAAWRPQPDAVPAAIPTDAQNAALIALKATTAAGNPLSGRQLETRFGLSRAEATRVRQMALGSPNGQRPQHAEDPSPDT